jgi:hypothetical protein
MKLAIMHFILFPVSSPSFSANTLLSTQFSDTLSLNYSLNVRDLVACPYNMAGKIIPTEKVHLNKQGNSVNQCCMISILTLLNNLLQKNIYNEIYSNYFHSIMMFMAKHVHCVLIITFVCWCPQKTCV